MCIVIKKQAIFLFFLKTLLYSFEFLKGKLEYFYFCNHYTTAIKCGKMKRATDRYEEHTE